MIIELNALQDGKEVKGVFAVSSKDGKGEGMRDYKDKPGKFFSIKIRNRTGEIPLKYWGAKDSKEIIAVFNSIDVGDIVEISGKTKYDVYDKRIVVNVNEEVKYGEVKGYIRKLGEEELKAVNFADFIPSLPEGRVDELVLEVHRLIGSVEDERIKELLEQFFSDKEFLSKFKSSPAAKSRHHAYLGGLLEHSLNVARLCEKLGSFYNLNRNLLIAGALLHDIGKMREYEIKRGAIDISEEGKLIGHIVIGEEEIRNRIKKAEEKAEKFPEELILKLLHIVISHHGELENGSPKEPKFPEALAVYLCDLADSQVKNMCQEYEKMKNEKVPLGS